MLKYIALWWLEMNDEILDVFGLIAEKLNKEVDTFAYNPEEMKQLVEEFLSRNEVILTKTCDNKWKLFLPSLHLIAYFEFAHGDITITNIEYFLEEVNFDTDGEYAIELILDILLKPFLQKNNKE